MINKNELRIGNFILKDGVIDKVTGIFHEVGYNSDPDIYYIQAMDKLDYTLESIEPITLDEDILVKCGFEDWTGNQGYYLHLGKNISDNLNIIFAFHLPSKTIEWANVGEDVDIRHIKSVHQLQNLISILTSTELTITL